jgi:serine/threonine protein kinase
MIGTTLQNRYRIDAELGHGARSVGAVYRAMDSQTGELVAVKVLNHCAGDRRRSEASIAQPDR